MTLHDHTLEQATSGTQTTVVSFEDNIAVRLATLTKTQLEVLRMVTQGFTNSEISSRRATSVSAVEQILKSIFRGLAIESKGPINPRSEAMRIYISLEGLPPREN
jgi:DNA-binding NarL/FixJ family response regulator